MGQFSWLAQDTKCPIYIAHYGVNRTYYMRDNKGNVWKEIAYEGYGTFGGKDYFVLMAEMNNAGDANNNEDLDDIRDIGIELYNNPRHDTIYPNVTETANWVWRNEKPQDDPNQGWPAANVRDKTPKMTRVVNTVKPKTVKKTQRVKC